ncbi:uncharacterized protein KQ657_000742 [Scheffersomyces spartinae]|uniref:Uncharacterized protein n=1 Tax=Scheffersomyces spartinae TaxID=45513 RepID=A0A9P7V8N8_9ASCO|nr:uncharacterized protein KQ657_000742 [Scheffersomyces spartinae]KAG7193326.1 hypothetical protein KQ657_000742 [Scheffersomyces spartinae]
MSIPSTTTKQLNSSSKSRPAFDSIFDKYLDSDSFDLDFEEAYSMYNNLQQTNAINGIEQLEQVQLLNQQYITKFTNDGKQGHVNGNMSALNRLYSLGDSGMYLDIPVDHHRYSHHHGHGDHGHTDSQHEFDAHRSQILLGNAAFAAAAAEAKPSRLKTHGQQHHSNSDAASILQHDHNGLNNSLPLPKKNYLLGSPQLRTFTDSNHIDFGSEQPAAKIKKEDPPAFQSLPEENIHHHQYVATSNERQASDEDQFFSNVESNALEKFLDNLFDSNYQDPLSLYPNANNNATSIQNQFKELNSLYDLHTMKPQLQTMDSDIQRHYYNASHKLDELANDIHNDIPDFAGDTYQLKRELTEVFAGSASDPLKPPGSISGGGDTVKLQQSQSGSESVISENVQLRTPVQSRQSFSGAYGRDVSEMPISGDAPPSQLSSAMKRNLEADNSNNNILQSDDDDKLDTNDGDDDENDLNSNRKKRKRSSSKPLLTLEQKRLHHSHSEQKRRKLCKLAYERCLRLVIDVEEYRKHAENCNNTPIQLVNGKKSRRAMINKDGLPNLSKHTALMKISNEIMTLQDLNKGLRDLLKEST